MRALRRACLVLFAKRAWRRSRHVALVGPAGAEWQLPDDAVASAKHAEHTRAEADRGAIERRTPREPPPPPQGEALVPRAKIAAELHFAQLPQQVRQRNLHRTDDAALVAHRRRERQVERLVEADVHRRQHAADRARVDPSIRMTADALVHRTMVHAGAAADTAQRLRYVASEHVAAAAVDDDEVHVLDAMEFAGFPDTGEDV